MDDLNQLLKGRTVLVTGAGPNIGRAIILEMARHGARVFFVDRDRSHCDAVEQLLKEQSLGGRGFVADITSQADIDTLHSTLQAENILVDVLINNAAVEFKKTPAREEMWQQWQATFNTNVIGPSYLTYLISQDMVSNNIAGSILFTTSIHQWTQGRNTSYTASKAALGMVVNQLALELAPHQIRVNGIAPGYTDIDEFGVPRPHSPTPLRGTSVTPEYIARAALYLSSEHFSKYTTGSILKVDAGLILQNHLAFPRPTSLRSVVSRTIRQLNPFSKSK